MKNNNEIRVFFFGDSICVGQGVSIHKGWVTRIAETLSMLAEETGNEIVTVNASVSGDQTRQALERMPYHIQSQDPDIVIVQFGMNDCNHWATDHGVARVSIKAFQANLEEMVVRSLNFGCRRVILHTNHPTGLDKEIMTNSTITYQESNALYNTAIRELVDSMNLPELSLIDVEREFNKVIGEGEARVEDFVLNDMLHLSEKGHDLYYKVTGPQIRAAVEELL